MPHLVVSHFASCINVDIVWFIWSAGVDTVSRNKTSAYRHSLHISLDFPFSASLLLRDVSSSRISEASSARAGQSCRPFSTSNDGGHSTSTLYRSDLEGSLTLEASHAFSSPPHYSFKRWIPRLLYSERSNSIGRKFGLPFKGCFSWPQSLVFKNAW